jgi:putative Holliday junction resolvase
MIGMRILAIDYGSRRIGLALSDPTGTLARPLPFVPAKADAKLAREIAGLAKKEKVHLILLGLPRNMDGSLGEAAAKVQAFAAVLGPTTPIAIKLIDERLSTVQASRQLQEAGKNARQQRGKIDSEAACVLLQGYLDSQTPFPLLPPDA